MAEKSYSSMALIYAKLVEAGKRKVENIPTELQAEVKEILKK